MDIHDPHSNTVSEKFVISPVYAKALAASADDAIHRPHVRERKSEDTVPLHPVGENIIFLDFDGVLNSKTTWKKDWTGPSASNEKLNPDMVKRAARLVKELPAQVVVSSAWRLYYDVSYLNEITAQFGMPVDAFIDRTKSIDSMDPRAERGGEIKEWLDRYPQVKRFVILDDSDDMFPVMGHLVQTTWEDGLQDNHVEAVLRHWARGRYDVR